MKQYKTKVKEIKFEDEDLCQLKFFHNLITNVHTNTEQYIDYNPQMTMIMNILMMDTNIKVVSDQGAFRKRLFLLPKHMYHGYWYSTCRKIISQFLCARYNVNPLNLQNKSDGCMKTFLVRHALS